MYEKQPELHPRGLVTQAHDGRRVFNMGLRYRSAAPKPTSGTVYGTSTYFNTAVKKPMKH